MRVAMHDPFFILGIETSTPAGGVAVVDCNGRCMAQDWWQDNRPVSTRLMKSIDSIMQFGLKGSMVPAAVSTTHGPGTFTGTRVGLGIAKVLALNWKIPLYTCSSLHALACRIEHPDCLVCPVLDARRGEVYHGLYETRGHALPQPIRPDEVTSVHTLISNLLQLERREIWFSGNGSILHRDLIESRLGGRARWSPAGLGLPSASSTAIAGLNAHLSGSNSSDPMTAAPLYLRPSDAEKRHRIKLPVHWSKS